LESRSSEGGSPSSGGRGSLLGLHELLLGVGSLSTVVGVTEDWAEDGEGGSVVENGAEGDSRWLDWWEVCRREKLVSKNHHFILKSSYCIFLFQFFHVFAVSIDVSIGFELLSFDSDVVTPYPSISSQQQARTHKQRGEIHTVKRHDCVGVRLIENVNGRFFKNLYLGQVD
jgi:hypothetical protein